MCSRALDIFCAFIWHWILSVEKFLRILEEFAAVKKLSPFLLGCTLH